jgi:hypothetical protein
MTRFDLGKNNPKKDFMHFSEYLIVVLENETRPLGQD